MNPVRASVLAAALTGVTAPTEDTGARLVLRFRASECQQVGGNWVGSTLDRTDPYRLLKQHMVRILKQRIAHTSDHPGTIA